MIYDRSSILYRLKATLPNHWFGESTPILDSVLNALSAGWTELFILLNYTTAQTRIVTSTDSWLDLIALDYFGYRVKRRSQEVDSSFSSRIRGELLRDRCTRAAIYDVLLDLTGAPPTIFEPANPQDTGCYASLTSTEGSLAGYGVSGGWGNLNMPFQALVRAVRPKPAGVAMVNGWGGNLGGYGDGLSSYISSGMNSAQATDTEIYQNVSRTAPIGTVVWMSIES